MGYKRIWEKARRLLAMVMAAALFLNEWTGYALLVLAETADQYTVTLSAETAEYTGENLLPTVTVTNTSDDSVIEEDDNYSVEWTFDGNTVTEAIAVGVYTCEVTGIAGGSCEDLSAEKTFEITEQPQVVTKTLTEEMVKLIPSSAVYTGEDITVSVEVKDGENTLVSGTDYKVVTASLTFKEVGTYEIAVQGLGNYTGTVTKSFAIAYALTEEMVTLIPLSGTYTGQDITVSVEVKNGETVLVKDTDYEIVTDSLTFQEVGSHAVEIRGLNDYTGTVTKNFVIAYDQTITKDQVTIEDVVLVNNIWYFKEQAVIRAAEGYEIVGGDKTISQDENNVSVLVKDQTTGTIGNIVLDMFMKDDTAPETVSLSVAYGNEYETDWAQAIDSAVFSAADSGCGLEGIYYTTDSEITDPADMTRCASGDSVSLAADTIYYYCAKDLLGNTSQIQSLRTRKLDNQSPVITVKDGETEIANGAVVYLNQDALTDVDGEKIKSYTVEVADQENGAGFDAAQVLRTEFKPADELMSETTVITNTVSDYVGNEGTHEFTVVYDMDKPVISDVAIDGITEKTILTKENVTVYANVSDANLKDVLLVNTADDSETYVMTETSEPGYTHMYTITTDTYKKADYRVKVNDLAGNNAISEDTLTVEIDKIAPELSYDDISIDQTLQNGWVNLDTTFTVHILNHDNSSAELYVEYKKDGDANWTEITDIIIDGENRYFSFKELDTIYNGSYLFRAGDSVGNVMQGEPIVYGIKKDKIFPKIDTILAEYQAYDGSDEMESKSRGLFAEVRTLLDRLFARTKIEVTLYIQDEGAGIKEIDYVCDGQSGTAEADSHATASIDDEIYYIVPVTVEGDRADVLKITRIQDLAGNTMGGNITPSVVTEGTTILVVDSVAPKIQVSCPQSTGNETGVKYYYPQSGQTKESITLTFTEAYYEKQVDTNGDPIKPQIRIFKNGTEETDVTSYVSWGDFSNNQISAKIDLPYDDTGNSEIVYQIQASYMDGSGNRLEWNGANDSFHSVTQENGYKSGKIILDNLAPEFTGYDAAGDTDKMIGTIPVYQNKGTDGDVTVTFTVEDTEQYWNPEAVTVQIFDASNRKVVNIQGNNTLVDWSGSVGSVHTGTYTFSGENDKASEYRVKISYTDKAGNVQILNQDSPLMIGTMTKGVYTSEPFILDHKTPELNVSQSSPVQVLNDIAYYADSFYVSFTIKEDYAVFANGTDITEGLEDCVLELYKDNQQIAMPEVAWMRDGTLYKGSFQIKKDTIAHSTDGNYQFKVIYQDCADNEISGSSPVMVLDTIAPEIAVSYEAIQGDKVIQNSYNGRDYYGQPVKMVLSVREVNGRYQELQDVLETAVVTDINGAAVTGSFQNSVAAIDPDSRTNKNGRVWEFNLSTDANYTIPLSYTDLAGNNVVYAAEKVTVDKTEPTFTLDYKVSASSFFDAINYKDFGFLFADGKLTIKVTASDQTAGIHRIWYTVTDEDGKVTKLEKEFAPSASNVYEVTIPLEKSDFKGSIVAEVFDWSANTLDQERGHIVESADRHSNTGSAVITTLTSASRSVGGEEYYNTDVKFNLTFKDTYSGLRKWSYTGGKTLSDSMDYAQAAGDDLTQIPAEAITYEYSQDLTLSASSNNENEIKVFGEFTDNAGHTGSVEQMYHIDVTVPVITVEYDLNAPSNEKFYNQTRTATVTIKERNFDESDVEFTITNTDGQMPSISGWSSSGSGDDTSNVCHVTFSADGDYTFTVAFQDKAGNAAEYSQVDEFTIDQTKPTVTVSYDHNQSTNEFYYAQSRTATIDVLEHNFDPALMEVLVTADGANVSMLSGWSKNGDHNVASVTFSADADYTFDLTGMDQAENPLDEYEIESFVVDQTPPELEIFDIEDMSANNGEVRPGIRYSDTNYDANGTEILMKGYHNGTLEMNGRTLHTANGVEVKLDDFERIPENDDLYTMEATVYDMAGNSSNASVTFSVNRFGSVYTFDEKTDDLVGDQGIYYVNKERELVVYETNVDTLEFKEITCNLNGSLTTLEEGTDYTVDMSGTDVSWKQYTYRIPKRNFTEEGTYILTIYSEDRAANTSDNHTKGKKIEFAVDKTNPSILISGVEQEGQYRENEREITLDVQDNIRLSDVEVRLNDQVSVYSSAEVNELDGKITLTAQSANYWQTLQVKAYDAAGNEQSSEELTFLVTSNILVQFFMNKPLFYGTLTGLASVTTGTGWFFRRRRRKLI